MKRLASGGTWPGAVVVKDESSTPQWLFRQLEDQVRALTGQGFHLDAAASDWNAKCRIFFDEQMDALRQDWSIFATIFCNPPFKASLVAQFVWKALDAAAKGLTVVLLLPSWPGHDWFQQLKRRGQMQDIITPVAFERPDGRKFILNKGSGVHLVAVTVGPTISPGTNAEPIRKRPATR